jgi:hypothetical protein
MHVAPGGVVPHLLRSNFPRDGHAQEPRGHHRYQFDGTQIDELQSRVGLVDVVDDQVGLTIKQLLPGASDGLDMQVQSGSWMTIEEGA